MEVWAPVRSAGGLAFVYKSSEIIENLSADRAFLRWAGQVMGLLRRSSPYHRNTNVKSDLWQTSDIGVFTKSTGRFSGQKDQCQDMQRAKSVKTSVISCLCQFSTETLFCVQVWRLWVSFISVSVLKQNPTWAFETEIEFTFCMGFRDMRGQEDEISAKTENIHEKTYLLLCQRYVLLSFHTNACEKK